MPPAVTRIADHFALAHFERALDNFQPPAEAFDPAGTWVNTYDLVVCSRGFARLGSLSLERSTAADGATRLQVAYRKRTAGGSLVCRADIRCARDELATPLGWDLETHSEGEAGTPIEDTRVGQTVDVAEEALVVQTAGSTRRISIGRPLALHWALFEAVQRLPREAGDPRQFTLVDRLSPQVKPHQTLSYRGSAAVELGGKRVWREERHDLEAGTVYKPVAAREGAVNVELHAYDQVGEGILPITYLVSGHGRLVFVLSGLIGYIFSPAGPR